MDNGMMAQHYILTVDIKHVTKADASGVNAKRDIVDVTRITVTSDTMNRVIDKAMAMLAVEKN